MASREAEALIQKYGGGWAADRAQAEQIRQDAKDAGTWGKTQEEIQNVISRGIVNAQKLDTQKKKEDAFSNKVNVDSVKIKRDRTKKEYDDYVKSDEYKKRVTENDQKARAEASAQMFLNPGQPMPQPKVIQDEREMQLRAAMETAEQEYNAAEDDKVIAEDLEAITGLSNEERRQLELYAVGRDVDYYESMNMAQNGFQMGRAQQNAADLIAKYGQERVDEMANTLSRQNNEKLTQQIAEMGQKHGDEHYVAGSLGSVAAGALGGIMGTMDYFKELGRNDQRFKTLDPNAMGNVGNVYSGAVRGQVQQNIEQGLGGGFLGKAASLGYQTVMTYADNIARAVLGGGAVGGAALAATGSFSQTMAEASRQGASPAQAALLATVNSGIEALSEKIPLDNLIRTAKGTGAKTVLLNALRQMGIESTTEEISLLGTVLAEAAILQEKSSYKQDIIAGITSGLSVDDAIIEANKKILGEALNTLLVSAASGGASSLTGSYADARGLFAQEQEQNNPALNQPKQSDVVKSVEDLRQKYGQPEAQQAAEQPQQAAAPAVEAQTTQTTEQAAQAPQQPQEEPRAKQSAVIDSVVETIQRNGGNVTNRMAESVLNDTAAKQKLFEQIGMEISGSKSQQRQIVKDALSQMAASQDTQAETAQNPPTAEPMQATETSEQATNQASAPQKDMQTGASNQSAEGVQIKGTGAAERNFSGVATYEDMLSDDNVQRQRPGAVRDVEMPKQDSDGRRVTEFAGNVVSAGVTPDAMADAVKSLVGDKQLSFDTRTNEQSLENAAKAIRDKGGETVMADIHAHAEAKTIEDGDIEKGLVLYAQYANDPNPDSQKAASQIIVDMAALANMSGRNLQLFSLLKRMTPEGQLMAVKKSIAKSIDDINKGRSAKKQIVYNPWQDNLEGAKSVASKRNVTIDEALEQNFVNAKTEEQKRAALDDIYKDVAAKIKPTLGEVWDAWRNLAMLGNIKTHERNVGATAAFQPFVSVKRAIGAALEKAFVEQDKRTKAVIGAGKADRALLDWAKDDAKNKSIQDLLGGATTGTEARSAIQDYRKILPGIFDKASKKNLDVMEQEDSFFKRGEYARSLAGFLKARGYTAEQIQNNAVPRAILDEGRQYAVKEAQKATFNDRNKLSDLVSKLNNVKNEGGGAVLNIFRKGVLPFLKTPANVVKRAIEYNPISMAKTMLTAKSDIDSGRKSAADVIDEISAGLTGSAAMALGAALAAGMVPGVELIGSLDDEDEKREGALEYSVRIGDKYYSIAWLAPAMIPLFIGANLYNKFSGWDDTADGWDVAQALFEVGADALDPMLELSMLSSLNDFVDNISNEETAGDKAMVAFVNAVTSYFTQGIPTVFGQIEQATEAEKKSTYVNTENNLERIVKSAVANATKRLPGDLYQTQKLDEFGQPVNHQGDTIDRIVEAFLNPFSTSTRKTDTVTKEITRLNKAGQDVTPNTAARTISYIDKDGEGHDEVRLTEEQYQKLAETQGQTARKLVEDMIQSKAYQALTDEQKAEAIDAAYLYARKTGEIAAIGDDHTGYDQSWMYDVNKGGGANELMRRVFNSSLNTSMSDLDNAWEKGYNEETFSRDMEEAYDSYQKAPASMKRQVYEEASGTAKKYMEARDKGLTHKEVISAIENVVKVHGTGAVNKETGKPTVRDIDRRKAIASTPGLSESAKDILMKAYMADYDPSDESPETTEFKYDYARKEMGLSATEYADTYKAYLDSSKKWDKIAAIRALGYDYGTALALYNLYNGRKKNELIKLYG